MTAAMRTLGSAFQAHANPMRRAVLERLGRGPATVKELAEPFDMALPSFMQNLDVLEDSGLIQSKKLGRVRILRIMPKNLKLAAKWLTMQRILWEHRLDQFDDYVKTLEEKE